MNKMSNDLQHKEYLFDQPAIASFGAANSNRLINGGTALGNHFGNGYIDDIGIAFWWKPEQWGPPVYGVFSWCEPDTGDVETHGIHMYVHNKDIFVKFVGSDGVGGTTTTVCKMTPREPEATGHYDTAYRDIHVWHFMRINFHHTTPANTCGVYMRQSGFENESQQTHTNGADETFSTGTAPISFDLADAELSIGQDLHEDSEGGALATSKIADFNVFNTIISTEGSQYMRGDYADPGPFKRRRIMSTPVGATGPATSYGTANVGLFNINHKCRLIATLPDPEDNVTEQYGQYIRNEVYWRTDKELGSLPINQWKSPMDDVSIGDNIDHSDSMLVSGDSLVASRWYKIKGQQTLDFTSSGSQNNIVGTVFCSTNTATLGSKDIVQRVTYSWVPAGGNKIGILYSTTYNNNFIIIQYIDNAAGASIALGNTTEFDSTVVANKSYQINFIAYSNATPNVLVNSGLSTLSGTQTQALTTSPKEYEFYIHGSGSDTITFGGLSGGNRVYLREFRIKLLPDFGAIDLHSNLVSAPDNADAQLIVDGAPIG